MRGREGGRKKEDMKITNNKNRRSYRGTWTPSRKQQEVCGCTDKEEEEEGNKEEFDRLESNTNHEDFHQRSTLKTVLPPGGYPLQCRQMSLHRSQKAPLKMGSKT